MDKAENARAIPDAAVEAAMKAWNAKSNEVDPLGKPVRWPEDFSAAQRGQARDCVRAAIQAALAALDGGEAVPVGYVNPEGLARIQRERGGFTPLFHFGPKAAPEEMAPVYAHPPRSEVERAVAEEREAWISELRPLIDAGALEGVVLQRCEKCGALLTIDEIAPANDWKECWRSATGRDKDPCQNESRPRIAAAIRSTP